jgi:hypothetical protein
MTGVYNSAIATAERLIAKFGASCVWSKPAEADGTGDPWRDERTGMPEDFDVSIAFFSAKDLGYGTTLALAAMAGTEVPDHNQMGLMAGGQAFDPELTDTLTFGEDTIDVTKIDKLAPNGTPVLYFLWLN